MKVAVKVLPRNQLLDTQGRAVEGTLLRHDKPVQSCRVGKYIVLEFEGLTDEQGLNKAKEVTEFVLHNPLTEEYELEVLR